MYSSDELKQIKKLREQGKYQHEIAEELGLSVSAVRRRLTAIGPVDMKTSPKPSPEKLTTRVVEPREIVERDRKLARLEAEVQQLRKVNKESLAQIERLDALVDAGAAIQDADTLPVRKKPDGKKSKSTAVLLISDNHAAKIVDPSQIRGKNEHDHHIFRSRMEYVVKNFQRLLALYRTIWDIDETIVHMGGDHVEQCLLHSEETTSASSLLPMEELEYAYGVLAGALTEIKPDLIVCSVGNHARITKKVWASNEGGVNLETILFNRLATEFKQTSTVLHSPAYRDIIDVKGHRFSLEHGHRLCGRGAGSGVGGIFPSVLRTIGKRNSNPADRSDFSVFGHYHQPLIHPTFCGNGSTVGQDMYSEGLNCLYSEPQQMMMLVSESRCPALVTPVYCR